MKSDKNYRMSRFTKTTKALMTKNPELRNQYKRMMIDAEASSENVRRSSLKGNKDN